MTPPAKMCHNVELLLRKEMNNDRGGKKKEIERKRIVSRRKRLVGGAKSSEGGNTKLEREKGGKKNKPCFTMVYADENGSVGRRKGSPLIKKHKCRLYLNI